MSRFSGPQQRGAMRAYRQARRDAAAERVRAAEQAAKAAYYEGLTPEQWAEELAMLDRHAAEQAAQQDGVS